MIFAKFWIEGPTLFSFDVVSKPIGGAFSMEYTLLPQEFAWA
jgi:hypothetical protein